MTFRFRKLEATGRTELGWDAGAMTAIGGICIGTGEPGMLWS